MLRAESMVGPIARKNRATTAAVIRDWMRTLRFWVEERLLVQADKKQQNAEGVKSYKKRHKTEKEYLLHDLGSPFWIIPRIA